MKKRRQAMLQAQNKTKKDQLMNESILFESTAK
jgi:hypothetical protein